MAPVGSTLLSTLTGNMGLAPSVKALLEPDATSSPRTVTPSVIQKLANGAKTASVTEYEVKPGTDRNTSVMADLAGLFNQDYPQGIAAKDRGGCVPNVALTGDKAKKAAKGVGQAIVSTDPNDPWGSPQQAFVQLLNNMKGKLVVYNGTGGPEQTITDNYLTHKSIKAKPLSQQEFLSLKPGTIVLQQSASLHRADLAVVVENHGKKSLVIVGTKRMPVTRGAYGNATSANFALVGRGDLVARAINTDIASQPLEQPQPAGKPVAAGAVAMTPGEQNKLRIQGLLQAGRDRLNASTIATKPNTEKPQVDIGTPVWNPNDMVATAGEDE